MPVPNSFANVTTSIPLSQLDANFNTPITLGNTAIQLGNTVTTLNNMTLANVTISSGNVTITNVSVTTANVTTANIATAVITTANVTTANITTGNVSGNLTFTGTGNRILGDFSNATIANRVAFQTSTTNSGTFLYVLPNGTSNSSGYTANSNSADPANASEAFLGVSSTAVVFNSNIRGTGTYLPMTFSTGGSERLRIDTAGNLGLGVTPSAWSLITANQIKNASFAGYLNRAYVFANSYFDGSSNRYIASDFATYYSQQSGQHQWYNAASGTAGNAITFTQAMTLDASGLLAIGRTSAWDSNALLTLEKSGVAAQVINSTTNTVTLVNVANGSSSVAYSGTASNHPYYFITNGTERARITSTGELLVGAAGMGNIYGARLSVEGTSGGSTASEFRVLGSALSTAATYFIKADNNTTTSNVFCKFVINSGGAASGQINANGASAAAFGSWSDERLKENIVDLPPQLGNICALRPVEFDYIESEGGGHQIGFVAQQMETIYPDVVGEREDGMKSITGWSKTEARLVKAIQELNAKVDAQAAEIAALKGNA